MKRCLHRKVDFKLNALNIAHILQQLHYKAEKLSKRRYYYILADQNKLIANEYKSQNKILRSVFERKQILYYKESMLTAVLLIISSVHFKWTYLLHERSL